MDSKHTEAETESEVQDQFAPLFNISARHRAKLFTDESLRLLAQLKVADLSRYMRLRDRLVANGVKNLREVEAAVDKRVRAAAKVARNNAAENADQTTPLGLARRFHEEVHPTLLWYQSDWLLHRGSHYDIVEPDLVRRDVYTFVEQIGEHPDSKTVGNVIDALKGVALVERGTRSPPCWLDEDDLDLPASEILACSNGLLHLPSGTLEEPTPRFFTRNGLPYAYDTDAPQPAHWLQFLDEVWGHDPEQITLLQEVIGYLLTPDTSMQKFFLFIGPTRSGKGTITKTITRLLGQASVCSPTLAKFGERFGLEAALGKQLATVSDMRLGSRTDRQDIVGNILRIVGEDDIDVERKHIGGAVTGKLAIRIVISSNLLPPLPDVSGAFAARLVTLTMKRSFLGEEDLTLDKKLEAELPGILNWAIEGWRRLKSQGHFTVTAESKATAAKIADLASPLNAFLRDCCVIEPSAREPKEKVWNRYVMFVADRALPAVYSSSNYFHRDLEAATQYRITDGRPVVEGKQVPHWLGLRLLPGEDHEASSEGP